VIAATPKNVSLCLREVLFPNLTEARLRLTAYQMHNAFVNLFRLLAVPQDLLATPHLKQRVAQIGEPKR
jgi:hypothetical protein